MISKKSQTQKGQKKLSLGTLGGKWSAKVKKRDDGKCRKCGKAEKVEAHHIVHRKHKATRYLLLNGITLCARGCHKWADTIEGREWVSKEIGDFAYSELRRLEQMDFKQFLQDSGKSEAEWLVEVNRELEAIK